MKLGRHGTLLALTAVVFTAAIAAPAAVMAQSGGDHPVPEDSRALLPESRWAELYCFEARWQVQAAHESVSDIETTFEGNEERLAAIDARVTVPDFENMRAELNAALAPVCEAETATEARTAAVALSDTIDEQLVAPFTVFESEVQSRLDAAQERLSQEIRTQVENYLSAQSATHTVRLQEEYEWRYNNYLHNLDRDPTPSDIESAEASASAYVSQLAEDTRVQVIANAQQLADNLRVEREQRLQDAATEMNALADRMRDRAVSSLSGTARSMLTEALQARRSAVMTMVNSRIDRFEDNIRAPMSSLSAERFDSVQLVLSDIAIDRDTLEQKLVEAAGLNDRVAFQAALTEFELAWQDRQQAFEATVLAGRLRCENLSGEVDSILQRAERLAGALPDEAGLPSGVQQKIGDIRDALDSVSQSAAQFNNACEAGDSTGDEITEIVGQVNSHSDSADQALDELRSLVGGGA